MPKDQQFCPFENDYFDKSEFGLVSGTLLHKVEPLHRATDGVLVSEGKGSVIPVSEMALMSSDESER